MNRWIKKAVEEANKSTFNPMVGAVIFNKGKFVSSGHNYKNRSIKSHHPKYRKTKYSIHAEVDAIIRARTDLKGKSLLVIRINRKGEFRLSKPCKWCFQYMKHVGIKACFYSISHYPYMEKMKIERENYE